MTAKQPFTTLVPKFVELIPPNDELVPGVIYISAKYKTVVHRCPCGCGGLSEFVLDPARHVMIYDGETVTFDPSIGISYLDCRSHYWIRRNRVEWCLPMRDWEIERARERERREALGTRKQQGSPRTKVIGSLRESLTKIWRK